MQILSYLRINNARYSLRMWCLLGDLACIKGHDYLFCHRALCIQYFVFDLIYLMLYKMDNRSRSEEFVKAVIREFKEFFANEFSEGEQMTHI